MVQDLEKIFIEVVKLDHVWIQNLRNRLTTKSGEYMKKIIWNPLTLWIGIPSVLECLLLGILDDEGSNLSSEELLRKAMISLFEMHRELALVQKAEHLRDNTKIIYVPNIGAMEAAKSWIQQNIEVDTQVGYKEVCSVWIKGMPFLKGLEGSPAINDFSLLEDSTDALTLNLSNPTLALLKRHGLGKEMKIMQFVDDLEEIYNKYQSANQVFPEEPIADLMNTMSDIVTRALQRSYRLVEEHPNTTQNQPKQQVLKSAMSAKIHDIEVSELDTRI